ncbi:MAG TPA: hypothetical protein VNS32_20105 [Flavisolibacter sp.]|nr:hypothetical protein [Flavisolibacter sp.]
MKRKRWTAKTEVDASLLQFREKRKWQIALRRYILERNKSTYYAPFFGLSIEKFRNWIEIQFDEDTNWDNFSETWQFDHVVPVAYFNFNNEEDMSLCWNFSNIRVEKTALNKDGETHVDVLGAKAYFTDLYQKTGYHICQRMVEKINQIEQSQITSNERLENFILENKEYLDHLESFSSYEYEKLNTGTELKAILYEIDFLKKFGT